MISKIKLQKGLTASIYLFLLVLIVSICILAWVPPVSRDALVHHLAVPKMWIKHGGIYEIPDLVFSYYPMNLDLLYTIPLYFGNDILPNYLHFAFALATSWLIFSYLKKRLEKTYALLGVLLFLSTPVIVKLSISAYVDLGLVFFSMAALVWILKWCKESIGTRYLVMAGLFCGLALGTKYNGLMVFFLMTPLIVSISFRKIPDDRTAPYRSLLYIMIFIVVAGLVYAPWGIKTTGTAIVFLFRFQGRWRYSREKNEKMVLIGFSILLILFVFFRTSMRIRYIAPAIPCLVILSIYGMKNILLTIDRYITGNARKIITGLSILAILILFSYNAVYILEQFRIVMPFQYISGKISRDQYIEKFRPEYAAIHHANSVLPSDAKILSLFIGGRVYYSDRNMVSDIHLFQAIIHGSASTEEAHSTLIDQVLPTY